MGKMLWHVTKSIDGSDADPDATMDRVFEHQEPSTSVGKARIMSISRITTWSTSPPA